jgi:hypothetical protein
MHIELLQDFFLWFLVIAYAILLFWFLVFASARSWVRRLHGRWFRLSEETFDSIHYGGMAIYKIGILLLALIPYLSLCLMHD